ncbi:protein CEBPZOS [Achroia grisella]|uniref:protein CEBPZOS n=1 Tax=Achroia grisella TaxID=688607 RepID=UPI0027D2C18C|nr:protein CEBPZOS [Achroia grisella]
MLTKTPKPAYKRFIGTSLKAIFFAEALGFAVSYGVYYKLNTDRAFRLYMYQNHSWVLEGYYQLGERIGGHKTRDLDKQVWSNEGKI